MKIHALLLSTILISMSSCGGGKDTNEPAPSPTPSSSSISSSAKSEASSSAISSSSSSMSSSSTANLPSSCITQECEAKNKESVLKIYTDAINKGQQNVIESLFDTNVSLHITGANNGITGEIAHLQTLKNNNPAYIATVKHSGAYGDYVAVHWHLSATPANEFSNKVAVDLYKFSGSKIVEHWFLSANLSASTASGNSLFSDLYIYPGTKPIATADTEFANKLFVTSTYTGIFNDKNLSLIDQNIAPGYLQHNPYVVNGSEALKNFVSSRAPAGLTFFATIADDDLVWTFSGDKTLTLVDIFRVDNKKIVEHYDVF